MTEDKGKKILKLRNFNETNEKEKIPSYSDKFKKTEESNLQEEKKHLEIQSFEANNDFEIKDNNKFIPNKTFRPAARSFDNANTKSSPEIITAEKKFYKRDPSLSYKLNERPPFQKPFGTRSFSSNYRNSDDNSGFRPRQFPRVEGEDRPKRSFEPGSNPNYVPREGGNPNYKPREYNPNYKPREFNSNYVPREGGNPNYKPREYNPNYVPREGGNPNYKPREYNPNYVPKEGGNPNYKPREYNPNYKPREFNSNYVPREGGNPNYKPRSYNPNYVPRPYNPNYVPREGGNPNYKPREYNPNFNGPRSGGNSNFNPSPFGLFKPSAFNKSNSSDIGKKSSFERKKKDADKDRNKFYKKDDDKSNRFSFTGKFDSSSLDYDSDFSVKRRREKQKPVNTVVKTVEITKAMTYKEFAPLLSVSLNNLINLSKKNGFEYATDDLVPEDVLEILTGECGHKAVRIDEKNFAKLNFPEILYNRNVARGPNVVIVGHVDHGKTSLLDVIRKSSLTKKEAGGITQNIGAYQINLTNYGKNKLNGSITFIDTPGHEAFTAMREQGAKLTDLAILVVSAEESVKTQTKEAISHIKKANLPIIVAVTKCDLPGANFAKVKQDLLSYDIVSADFGGDVTFVEVSALKNINIDLLLEMILLQGQMMDLKADFENINARGYVIDSYINPKIGVVTNVLITEGKLRKDFVISGISSGKIKSITNDLGQRIDFATPGMAVELIGLDSCSESGSILGSFQDLKIAAEILKARKEKFEEDSKPKRKVVTLEALTQEVLPGLNLILKASSNGALEALKYSLNNLSNDKTTIEIVAASVGPIKELDIELAHISNAKIVCFNVSNTTAMIKTAFDKNVQIIEDKIIYKIIETVEGMLSGLIQPVKTEVYQGMARVDMVFTSSKIGKIAGCVVKDGSITKEIAKVYRDSKIIFEGQLSGLKRFKDDVKEVKSGFECGISLKDFNEFLPGDEIHCYKLEYV